MLPYIVIDPRGETIATLVRAEDVACILACYGTGCIVLRASDHAVVWSADDTVPDDLDAITESFVRYGTACVRCH